MRGLVSCSLLPLLALAVGAQDAQLRVFHRIFDPRSDLVSPYTERGSLNFPVNAAPALVTAHTAAEDLQTWAITYVDRPTALYQLALERLGDHSKSEWDVSTVKACHLAHASADTLILHATVDMQPFALDYYLTPVPHDGSCSPSSISPLAPFLAQHNTSISLRVPRTPPRPSLRPPPALSATGQPVLPEADKSFIQKYWMYIVAIVFVFLLTGGAPDAEDPRAKGAAPAGR